MPFINHFRQHFWWMLHVSIHCDNSVASGHVKPCPQGVLVAEISGKGKVENCFMLKSCPFYFRKRVVAAAVINKNNPSCDL